jgi:hypothetical protein
MGLAVFGRSALTGRQHLATNLAQHSRHHGTTVIRATSTPNFLGEER